MEGGREKKTEGKKEGGRVGDWKRERRRRGIRILMCLLVFKIEVVQKGSKYGLRSHVI